MKVAERPAGFDPRRWQREFRKTPAGKLHVRKMGDDPERLEQLFAYRRKYA